MALFRDTLNSRCCGYFKIRGHIIFAILLKKNRDLVRVLPSNVSLHTCGICHNKTIKSTRPTILARSPWDTQEKHAHNWTFVKTPRVSLLLCLYHTVLVTALPLLPQAMLKAPAMILGVKGPSNQHCIGGGGGMREFGVFLRKCPKTFGQDCTIWTSLKQLQSHFL